MVLLEFFNDLILPVAP